MRISQVLMQAFFIVPVIVVDAIMHEDGPQPAFKRPALVLVERLKGLDPCILKHILGLWSVRNVAQAHGQHAPAVPLVQGLLRRRLVLKAAFYYFLVSCVHGADGTDAYMADASYWLLVVKDGCGTQKPVRPTAMATRVLDTCQELIASGSSAA